MSDQLTLFVAEADGNGADHRGSVGHGPAGLLRALQREGLAPDALEVAARLCLLLDAEAAAEDV